MAQASATITMTMREVDRIKTMQALVDRMLRPAQAAARLGLTVRQVARLAQRYRDDGPEGLVSRKRGKPSNNQLSAGVADRALRIVRERYADFGPTLAAEKLAELHGLKIGVETLRGLMTAAGLWTPRKQRAPKIHQPRNRRSCLGELIQIDGSDHAWFEDRAPKCTLLVFIDDATSRLMQLHFVPTESSFAYFEATRGYIEQHGKPVAFYSDKASIFRAVQTSTDFGRGATQYGRALFELNIDIMCANTSQAKGRVERANLTLQDRLVKELRLRGINTRDAANAFAPRFMADFNARFAKPARRDFDAHRPVRADEDLDLIFTWRLQRKVSLSLTLQHDRVIYLLKDTPANRKLIHRYIDVYEYPDGRIELRADGVSLAYERYDRLPQVDAAAIVENKRLGHALQAALVIQSQRDDRRKSSTPSRTNQGQAPYPRKALPGAKRSRQFTSEDLELAVMSVCKPPAPPHRAALK
ncbi:ISNCY family transposase [Variovorax sp. E3]|uniref:ISNCY family transposase n=1 Tax=Variovorax sp. E3 TaxID=1914993 RepID=UPI0018DD7BBC|nr:ISNCY family transposase [Variovorax sp. E3]